MTASTRSDLPPEDEILFAVSDGIATITLNRPQQRNALSRRANERLFDLWSTIDADASIAVVILTSSDCGVFCAGMDLREAAQLRQETGKDILDLLPDPMYQRMRSVKAPIIAAMTGHFTAAGMVLALNSDLRIGLRDTRGGITETRVGRGSPWAVPMLWMVPQPVLMEMVLTGEMIDIARLHQLGFINYVEDTPQAVRDRARTLAANIQANAPLSVRAAKASLLAAMELSTGPGFERAQQIFALVYASEDAQEGPRAFAEKRKPVWKGR